MPKAKKRALSSSSDSSEAEGTAESKVQEKAKKKNHLEKKVKTTTTSSSDEQGKAKKTKKDKQEKPKEVPKEAQPPKEPEKKKPAEKESDKSVKTTTVKDMLRAKRDNMRKIEQGKAAGSGTATATDDDGESESVSSLAVSESSRDSHPDAGQSNGVVEIPLPESLSHEVSVLIAKLKQYAATAPKGHFFDDNVLDQLVTIDNGAKSISPTVRIQTFNYLEQFVPCTKKTLFGKVRKHRVEQLENKVKVEVDKLKQIVNEIMPAILAKYELDIVQQEELRKIQVVIGDTPREVVLPRKKYHWNDNSRSVLSDVIQRIRDIYRAQRSKKESEEVFVCQKLRETVVPLWPEGWIKVEDFQKELERKKKKEARISAMAAASPQDSSHVPTKSNTANTNFTNGNAPANAQKTELNVKKADADNPILNGKLSAQKSSVQLPSTTSPSVIKRSSDHSINSIISSSPSPPTTSQQIKVQDSGKTRVIELEALPSSVDVLKGTQQKSVPKFRASPADNFTSDKPKNRRSDSSDSDCVEIVGEFNPIKPAKSMYNHNNNKTGDSPTPYPAPVAKKSKHVENEEGEHEPDYSKLILGLRSLTVSLIKFNQLLCL